MEYHIYRFGMVFNIKPVADVLPFAVYRYVLAFPDVIDCQWYQLFGKLVGSVVI
jgi:hypothetical protein